VCLIEAFRGDMRKGDAKGNEGYEKGKGRLEMGIGETLDWKGRRARE